MAQKETQNLQLIQELEIEMMADMYNRLITACHKKCIPPIYGDAEIAKGESGVAKFLDIHERIGKKLGQLSMQDEALLKNICVYTWARKFIPERRQAGIGGSERFKR
ncbi:hypothetical protein NQ317_005376 [Molorchus minor]|uniref:Mitochondrial import inner membrane translocase subunit n=1 Tax=Molorchus minor TaxID=1323400 RepID=A0ABQ9IPV1_9CUCU|nr:hypothetical protein NQ317_005376 [Molorchus minor]